MGMKPKKMRRTHTPLVRPLHLQNSQDEEQHRKRRRVEEEEESSDTSEAGDGYPYKKSYCDGCSYCRQFI
jgi:hypothetical protein